MLSELYIWENWRIKNHEKEKNRIIIIDRIIADF